MEAQIAHAVYLLIVGNLTILVGKLMTRVCRLILVDLIAYRRGHSA